MIRLFRVVLKASTKKITSLSLSNTSYAKSNILQEHPRYISALAKQLQWQDNLNLKNTNTNILRHSLDKLLVPILQSATVPYRGVTKFSLKLGKRKTVKTVIKRFYRLNWGIWIRTIAGRHKHLWKKSKKRKVRAKQHVFTNATQSWMLDRMVTKFWKRPKFFVNDPYTPYHTREEFIFTQKKPKPIT